MFEKRSQILPIFISCIATSLCFLCVCLAVLAKPKTKTADITDSRVEYTAPPQQTEYVLLDCECGIYALLVIDFEQKIVSLSPYTDGAQNIVTAKIKVSPALFGALCDNAGGINFDLPYDTELLKQGSWRLTGSQVWQLIHSSDQTLKEQLLCEYFYTVFMFGLKNDQIYIILEEGVCDNLSYSKLYNIALYSKEWLSQLTVIS